MQGASEGKVEPARLLSFSTRGMKDVESVKFVRSKELDCFSHTNHIVRSLCMDL